MIQSCTALTGTVAATIALNCANEVKLSNPSSDVVYLKFNWTSGDTEVSATNYDSIIPAGQIWSMANNIRSPRLNNVRVLCASSISLGVMGW